MVFSSAFLIFTVKNRQEIGQKKENSTSRSRCVDSYICPSCNSDNVVKNGKARNGEQRFQCKECSKYFIIDYTYNAYQPNINPQITLFTKEGLGIRSTAQILRISVTTLLKRIISITEGFVQPF